MTNLTYKWFRRWIYGHFWPLLMLLSLTVLVSILQDCPADIPLRPRTQSALLINHSHVELYQGNTNIKLGSSGLSFDIFPVLEDYEVNPTSSLTKGWIFGSVLPRFSSDAAESTIVKFLTTSSQFVKQSEYLQWPAPSPPEGFKIAQKTSFISSKRSEDDGPWLHGVGEYFEYLENPNWVCRKLVMLGGTPTCNKETNFLDGNKIICMDSELEFPSGRDPQQCLTLSFGVYLDTTFDEEMANLPCEVHMFDILDYTPTTLLEKKHVHFHKTGLGEQRRSNFYSDVNQSFPVDSVDGLLVRLNLMTRPIHVLKVDIEDDEWEIFRHLVKQPILDIVGQIAMEVHAEDLLREAPEKQLAYLQKRYTVLRAIEGRGFNLVAYWPNKQTEAYVDEGNSRHDLCGELLYVNSNWYNASFKDILKEYGFQFK